MYITCSLCEQVMIDVIEAISHEGLGLTDTYMYIYTYIYIYTYVYIDR